MWLIFISCQETWKEVIQDWILKLTEIKVLLSICPVKIYFYRQLCNTAKIPLHLTVHFMLHWQNIQWRGEAFSYQRPLVVLIHKQTQQICGPTEDGGFQKVTREVVVCFHFTQKLCRLPKIIMTFRHHRAENEDGNPVTMTLTLKTNTSVKNIKAWTTSISWLIDPHWGTCFGSQAADKSHSGAWPHLNYTHTN